MTLRNFLYRNTFLTLTVYFEPETPVAGQTGEMIEEEEEAEQAVDQVLPENHSSIKEAKPEQSAIFEEEIVEMQKDLTMIESEIDLSSIPEDFLDQVKIDSSKIKHTEEEEDVTLERENSILVIIKIQRWT